MSCKSTPEPAPMCISYLRWSTAEQGKGASLKRQTDLRDAWLLRNGLTLDTDLVDAGVSGHKGRHRQEPDKHALARFLEMVRRGDVPKGSDLIVENLDRLSREDVDEALELMLGLTRSGIRIVQLQPVEVVYQKPVDPMKLVMAIMELSRGNSESVTKSTRVGDAWRRKKEEAATKKRPITAWCPAWLTIEGGKFRVKPGAADTIRKIYRLATEGEGIAGIVRALNREKLPTWTGARKWTNTPVAHLLRDRRPTGEYQPRAGTSRNGRRKEGAPIPGFFPAIITEDEWALARQAVERRKVSHGPTSTDRVYLWGGLLKDARDGGVITPRNETQGRSRKLVNAGALRGEEGKVFVSFPEDAFEQAVLSTLREITPADIQPGAKGGPDDIETLRARRDWLTTRLEELKAELRGGNRSVSVLAESAREAEEELEEVIGKLAAAQRKLATPTAEAWADYPTLLKALEGAEDKKAARLRLRSALRNMVDGITCLFIDRGLTRIAAVQIAFVGGGMRHYLIVHRAAHGKSKCPASTEVESFAAAGAPGELDLRKPADAKKVEKLLARLEL